MQMGQHAVVVAFTYCPDSLASFYPLSNRDSHIAQVHVACKIGAMLDNNAVAPGFAWKKARKNDRAALNGMYRLTQIGITARRMVEVNASVPVTRWY